MGTKIIGTGSFVPDHVVTNNHLAELVETRMDTQQNRNCPKKDIG